MYVKSLDGFIYSLKNEQYEISYKLILFITYYIHLIHHFTQFLLKRSMVQNDEHPSHKYAQIIIITTEEGTDTPLEFLQGCVSI